MYDRRSLENSYAVLEPREIIGTVSKLHSRIVERFPNSGLSRVCLRLNQIAQQAHDRSHWIERPIRWLRILVGLGCVLFVGFCGYAIYLAATDLNRDPNQTLAHLDEVSNVLLFVVGLVIFLWTLEIRLKRNRALAAIHELRAVAHIIDMHQLTKDPERTAPIATTRSSPKLAMTRFELKRYLDYCSEMLSLVGKIAAIYVQHFDDSVALSSANQVEALTTGLSQKIWQKILILSSFGDENHSPAKPLMGVPQPLANEESSKTDTDK
jgi:hypothetical protein